MDHIPVLKAPDHMDDSIYLADVGEELVPQPFTLRSALHQAGDIHKLDRGRRDLRRIIQGRQLL